MTRLALTAALTANDRTRPLLDGAVTSDTIALDAVALDPAEIFYRQLKFQEFDVSEMSLASLLIATSHGTTPWVAIPAFTMRAFFHATILVRNGAGISAPTDLHGKRVGVAEYQQTRSVWQRGILQHEFGVDARRIRWVMERTAEVSHGGATGFTTPPGIDLTYMSPATDMGAMLVAGELDAALHLYVNKNLVDRAITDVRHDPRVGRLFADPEAEGRRYFAKTGIFPINHCVVVRRSLAHRYPWLTRAIYDLFLAAKKPEHAAFAYGVQSSRAVLETIATYLYEQGLTKRTVALAEIFPEPMLAV